MDREDRSSASPASDASPPLDVGARHRMRYEAPRISRQHDQLNTLFGAVLASLYRDAVHCAHAEFLRFADALEAHFSLEDRLYFPALHGLHPDLTPSLDALGEEHDGMRRRVAEIRALLSAGERETSRERLDELAGGLADHEAREESLIARATGSKSRAQPQAPAGDAERKADREEP